MKNPQLQDGQWQLQLKKESQWLLMNLVKFEQPMVVLFQQQQSEVLFDLGPLMSDLHHGPIVFDQHALGIMVLEHCHLNQVSVVQEFDFRDQLIILQDFDLWLSPLIAQ